ncbi:MAG: AIR synthase-related protein [Candidatus Aramenus sp.]|jgi:hydrogenase expression/formation protein|nr:AIR synthase-related protein [Candidatus Aramenus sp.]
MDLEGIARRVQGERAKEIIVQWLDFYKGRRGDLNEKLADAVIKEVENSRMASKYEPVPSGIRAGDAGLGSRGVGDHLIHLKLFEISGRKPSTFDDAGVMDDVVVAVDGIHSRLSYFPFLAGFHATKACLRDVMVKGATPLGVLIDVHLADDADLSYLFDFEAGVSTVAEALGVGVLAGSTLRIGGDVVIGERISGGVGAVGKLGKKFLSRARIKEGMRIYMTRGNGGGTVSATAIYGGFPEVVEETLRVEELLVAKVVNERFMDKVEAMTDVTNGGIRGDALEVSEVSKVSFVIDEDEFLSMINRKVLNMFRALDVDPFGVSIDSLLIFSPADNLEEELRKAGVEVKEIGYVDRFKDYPILTISGKRLEPRFRESPYTPVKKVIGNYSPYSMEELKNALDEASRVAIERKRETLKNLKGGNV